MAAMMVQPGALRVTSGARVVTRPRAMRGAMATSSSNAPSPSSGAGTVALSAVRSTFSGAKLCSSRGVGRARRQQPVMRPAAVASPNEINELAGAAMMTLGGAEAILGKVSFGTLLTATSVYWTKVRA